MNTPGSNRREWGSQRLGPRRLTLGGDGDRPSLGGGWEPPAHATAEDPEAGLPARCHSHDWGPPGPAARPPRRARPGAPQVTPHSGLLRWPQALDSAPGDIFWLVERQLRDRGGAGKKHGDPRESLAPGVVGDGGCSRRLFSETKRACCTTVKLSNRDHSPGLTLILSLVVCICSDLS